MNSVTKKMFKKYWLVLIVFWVILWIIVYFWYNWIVSNDEQITIYQSLFYSLLFSLAIFIVITNNKKSFHLYFVFTLIMWFYVLYNISYKNIITTIYWTEIKAKIISKQEVFDRYIFFYRNNNYYIYYENKNEKVNVFKYNEVKIWDEIKIKSYNWITSIIWWTPYLSYFIVLFYFTIVLYLYNYYYKNTFKKLKS